MASARGVWMTDADGRRYLDAYNNVPCVGHSHPRVVEAIARQARRLNTNMRYLHETAIELAERLSGDLPGGLDTVMFVNSGLRGERPRVADGDGVHREPRRAVHDRAYHGITEAIAALSPERVGGAVGRPARRDLGAARRAIAGRTATRPSFAAALERSRRAGSRRPPRSSMGS